MPTTTSLEEVQRERVVKHVFVCVRIRLKTARAPATANGECSIMHARRRRARIASRGSMTIIRFERIFLVDVRSCPLAAAFRLISPTRPGGEQLELRPGSATANRDGGIPAPTPEEIVPHPAAVVAVNPELDRASHHV